ncbi:MAG: hypothetical protein FJY20_03760 [Bacteroidetes bacterium]|nr:hypothetical protein [Bacteroidota bacterium]
MQTTIHQQVFSDSQTLGQSHPSLWKRFIQWADGQEKNRFGWTAGILAGHGCVATILTMLAIVFTGNHFIFWPFAIVAMAVCVVTNLAAMPTRITIPVFFFSLLVDLVIIAVCIANGFDVNATYV